MRDLRKEILVIVESIDIESSSGAKANIALINNLHKCGYKLTILHYSGKEVHLSGLNVALIRENKKSLFFLLSRFEGLIRRAFKWSGNRLAENFFGFSFKLFSDRDSIAKKVRKIKSEQFSFVITLSHGGSFRPHHALLKLPHLHSKWLAYIHDPYPMHHFPPPYTWTETGAEKKETFIKEISEKAAFSAFPSKLLLEWMVQFYPQFQKTGVVIPHQIAPEEISHKDFPDWYDLRAFNVVHAGNLLWGRDPEGLVEGFQLFLEHCPDAKANAKLTFIGGKNHYSEMLNQKAQKFSGLYCIERNIPFDMVRKIQNSCAVNVILEAKSGMSPFLPGKFPHCIVAEKPILLLGPAKSESRRLLGEDYPYWAEIDSSEKIAALIEILYNNWKNNVSVKLVRPDQHRYLSDVRLKEVLNNLKYQISI